MGRRDGKLAAAVTIGPGGVFRGAAFLFANPDGSIIQRRPAKARSKKAESRNTVHGGRTNESRLEDCGTPWVLARECATALASRQKCQSFLRNKNADTPPPF
jgi:hypothetical protein